MPNKGKKMKNKRIFNILMLIALGAIIVPFASAIAEEAPVERYVLNVEPSQYPGIAMNYQDPLHELHVDALMEAGLDCTPCHYDNDEKTFMGVSISDNNMDAYEKRNFLHNACASCHADIGKGPAITECRSCHNPEYAPKSGLEAIM